MRTVVRGDVHKGAACVGRDEVGAGADAVEGDARRRGVSAVEDVDVRGRPIDRQDGGAREPVAVAVVRDENALGDGDGVADAAVSARRVCRLLRIFARLA